MVYGFNESIDCEIVTSMDMQQEDVADVQLERSAAFESRHMSINVEDYIFHGDELEDYSIYELTMIMYCRGIDRVTIE